MPYYFFHIIDGENLVLDEEGEEFADPQGARAEVIKSARELMAHELMAGNPMGRSRVFVVKNQAGEVAFELCFADAIPDEPAA